MLAWLLLLLVLRIRFCFSLLQDPVPIPVSSLGPINTTANGGSNRPQSFEEIIFTGTSRIHRNYPFAQPLHIMAIHPSLFSSSPSSLVSDLSFTVISGVNAGQSPFVSAENPAGASGWRGPAPATEPHFQVVLRPFIYTRSGYPIKLLTALAAVEAVGFGNQWAAVHFFRVDDTMAGERWDQPTGHVFGFTRKRDREPRMKDFVFVGARSGNVLDWDESWVSGGSGNASVVRGTS